MGVDTAMLRGGMARDKPKGPSPKVSPRQIRLVSSVVVASALHAGCREFDPLTRHHIGGIAQLGERLVCNQNVAGSIPVTSTKYAGLV